MHDVASAAALRDKRGQLSCAGTLENGNLVLLEAVEDTRSELLELTVRWCTYVPQHSGVVGDNWADDQFN